MVFIDQCHTFITTFFTTMLTEVRKYKIGLYLTHQYLEQLHEDVRSAVLDNIGSIVIFKLGSADAKVMAMYFADMNGKRRFHQ